MVLSSSVSVFPSRFSVTILMETTPSWISGILCNGYYINQFVLHPGKKVISVLMVEQSFYQRKHLTNEDTIPGHLPHIMHTYMHT